MNEPRGLDLRATREGTSIRIRVQPRSRREGTGGVRGGALVVRVAAPPVEGRANAAVVQVLAGVLGVAPSAVAIAQGAASADKRVLVSGLGVEQVRARLEPAGAAVR